ncbi:MAG: hypothetical protein J6O51_04995 [Bacteroidales bacterium]|nr:hypothetical protein [Bacteroidales bacterium]
MKKLYIFGAFALAVLALAACNKEAEIVPAVQEDNITITATREDGATRTVVQPDGKSVWWSAAETIDLFYGPGETGAQFVGENSEPAASATFKGNLERSASLDEYPAAARHYFGIYPSSSDNKVGSDGSVCLTLRSAQTAVAGTFESNLFPAVAVSDTTTMRFLNVAGGIKFSIGEDNVTSVVIRGNASEAIAGRVVVEFGDAWIPTVANVLSGSTEVTVSAPEGGFVKGESYYAVLLPCKFESGITFTLNHASGDPVVIVSEKALEVKRGVIGKVGELKSMPALKVERLWGKYSTADSSWNEYFGGAVNSDRNVAMDDEYIYIAEANKTKNLWALKVEDGSLYKALPTSTVKDAGTFYLSCPRVMNLSGEPVLVVCNMTEDASSSPLYLYVYQNGIEEEPTAIKLINGAGRLGDTFTFWGASATNSADGQGLSKGMIYFDAMFSGDGIRIWKTNGWAKGSLPSMDQAVQSRYGFDNGSSAGGAFWTYPENKDAGIWGARNYEVKSVYGSVAAGAPNLWSATGNQLSNTVCEVIESGWYTSVPSYQFFSYNGHRYVAYTRQVGGNDGRLIILEGDATEAWSSIITNHKVVYNAAIQEDAENQGEYNTSVRSSGNNAMDLCIRVKEDGVYLVCLKQNVGLSLFKMTAN